MILTECDFEKLLNQIELIKSRKEKLPETLSFLTERLKFAIKVTSKNIPADAVTMNSFVTINWMNTGIIRTINLVYPEFEDAGEWKISVFSTLGAALLGRRQGDETVYRIRKRDFRIKIMGVVFQPEAFGNYYEKKTNMPENRLT